MIRNYYDVMIDDKPYIRCGEAYLPVKAATVDGKHVGTYGLMHKVYLDQAHPADVQYLEENGLLCAYLSVVNFEAQKRYDDRVSNVADRFEGWDSPTVDEFYARFNAVTHNTELWIENHLLYTPMHEDIVNSLLSLRKGKKSEAADKLWKDLRENHAGVYVPRQPSSRSGKKARA